MKTVLAMLMMCLAGFAFADGHLESEGGHHAEADAGSATTLRMGPMQSKATRVKRKATRMQNSLSNSSRA